MFNESIIISDSTLCYSFESRFIRISISLVSAADIGPMTRGAKAI